MLLIPEINALEDGLGNLSFHVVEGKVTMNRLVFGAIHVPVGLHGCAEWIHYGDRTFILNNICFLLTSRVHVNVSSEGVIYKGVWL